MYYYTGRPYRVTHVDVRSKTVQVYPSAHYSTQAVPVRSRISPQRTIHRSQQRGDLMVAECDIQTWRAVLGFRERRGSVVEQISYPCDTPVRWNASSFSRSFFSTGVCIAHPMLDGDDVDTRVLSTLLHEAFLMVIPLDRQDVDSSERWSQHQLGSDGSWASIPRRLRSGLRQLAPKRSPYGRRRSDQGIGAGFGSRIAEISSYGRSERVAQRSTKPREPPRVLFPKQAATSGACCWFLIQHGTAMSASACCFPEAAVFRKNRPSDVFRIHQVFMR